MRLPGVGCVTAGNRPSGGTSSSDALGAGRHADGPRWSFNTTDRPHPPAYHRLRRLACARGDATTRRPAGWDASLPRLRAWGCYLYAACLDRMQGASPARVGMLPLRRLPRPHAGRLACARGDAAACRALLCCAPAPRLRAWGCYWLVSSTSSSWRRVQGGTPGQGGPASVRPTGRRGGSTTPPLDPRSATIPAERC